MKTRIGKRRTGRLFKHGAGYAVAWTVNGKRMFQSLRDAKGKPITDLRKAETARAELMAPFRAGDEKAVLENIVGKLATATAELDRVEQEQTPALPITAAWQAYVAAPSRPDSGPRTLAGYEGQWDRFAAWMQATHPAKPCLCDVSREIAGEYSSDLSRDSGPATHNKHVALLSLVFRTLADNPAARLTVDPFGKVTHKRAAPNSRRELTIEELRRVCNAATGELRTLLAIGTYTGLRLGDAATLRWGEVDLIRGAILRIPNKTARRKAQPVTVPLHPALSAILAETPEKRRRSYVLPETAALYLADDAALSGRIQDHFTANGVQTVKEGTGFVMVKGKDGKEKPTHTGKRAVVEVGFHSLRHTFVSLCRAAGAPLSVVEAIVGHSSPAMTQHYTHTGEAAARLAIGSLPGLTEGNPKRTPAARLARLLAKAEKLTPDKAKRALLRLLAWHRVKKQD